MSRKVFEISGIQYEYSQLRGKYQNVSFPSRDVITQADLPDGVTLVIIEDPIAAVPTLDELKTSKAQEIRNHSDILIAQVSQGYSQGEVDTFAEQYAGAKAILSGGGDLFVTGLLSNRLGRVPTQTELTEFANLIIANYERAKNAIVTIIGTQQRLELAIRAATTENEVNKIVWIRD